MNKTFQVELTERELFVLVKALETEKREAFRNNDKMACEEAVELRNKIRNVK